MSGAILLVALAMRRLSDPALLELLRDATEEVVRVVASRELFRRMLDEA